MTETSVKERLDRVGVPIGPKTTRNGLLDLLSRHVIRKKLRADKDQHRIKPASQIARGREITPSVPSIAPPIVPASPPADEVQVQPPQVDFSRFDDTQLAHLLRDLGVNATGLNRDTLISQCQAYNELSEYHPFVIKFILCSSLILGFLFENKLVIVPAEVLNEVSNADQSTVLNRSSTFTLDIPFGGSKQQKISTTSSSVISTKTVGLKDNGAALELVPRIPSRRSSQASTVRSSKGLESSPALVQTPTSKSSVKASTSKRLLRSGTSKGSSDASKLRLSELPAPPSSGHTASKKGKGVDREGETSMNLETQSTGKFYHLEIFLNLISVLSFVLSFILVFFKSKTGQVTRLSHGLPPLGKLLRTRTINPPRIVNQYRLPKNQAVLD